jgi:hypothetical protein
LLQLPDLLVATYRIVSIAVRLLSPKVMQR